MATTIFIIYHRVRYRFHCQSFGLQLLGQVLKYTVSYLGSPDQTPSDAAWRREFCHRQICFADACTGTNTSILIYWNDDIPDRKGTTHVVTGSPIAALRALEAWHGVCDYTKHKTLGEGTTLVNTAGVADSLGVRCVKLTQPRFVSGGGI